MRQVVKLPRSRCVEHMSRAYQSTNTTLSSQRERGGLQPGAKERCSSKGAKEQQRSVGAKEPRSLGANECQTSVKRVSRSLPRSTKRRARIGANGI